MKNPRVSAKERNLLKGAIRRVFSRSELRRKVLAASVIEYTDPTRPRVRKWSRCAHCPVPTPTYLAQVDHIDPIVPVNRTLEDMTWDEIIDRIWTDSIGLQVLCKDCHSKKSKQENAIRRTVKRAA